MIRRNVRLCAILCGLIVFACFRMPSVSAEVTAPTTAAKAITLLDLKTVPRLEVKQLLDDSATYLYYSAKAGVPGGAAFYEGELSSRGWQKIPNSMPDNPMYRDLLFAKDGYYLRVTVGASGDEGITGISVSHFGNVDLQTLPRLDDAPVNEGSSPVNVSYSTPKSIAEATQFCRESFSKLGWHEYRDSLGEVPEVPHVKSLTFSRNAVRVMVSIVRDPRNPQLRDTIVAYMSHYVLPFDFPVVEGAEKVVIDTIQSKGEYQTSATLPQVVEFLRSSAESAGWREHSDKAHLTDKHATLWMEGADQMGCVIRVTAEDKTHVRLERISFAEQPPEEEEQPTADPPGPSPDEIAAQEQANNEANEFSRQLKAEIQGTLQREMKGVQNELQKLGVGVPGNLGDLAKDLAGDDADDESSERDEDAESDRDDDDEPESDDKPVRDDSAALAKLPRGKSICKIKYDGMTYELKHTLAVKKREGGTPVILFCQDPLDAGRAQRIMAKGEDPSVLDLSTNKQGFSPSMELRLEDSYTSISCFVGGASINRGSNDFKQEFLVSPQRVRGTVVCPDGEEALGKPFHFEAVFDLDFLGEKPTQPGKEEDLVANSQYDFPVPEDCNGVSQQSSNYRKTLNAEVEVALARLWAFYNRELPARGWKLVSKPTAGAQESISNWTGPEGTLVLKLVQQDQRCQIEGVIRNAKVAQQQGIAPAAGQGMLVLANASGAEVVVTLGKRVYKLPAGKGAKDPSDSVKIPVLPGKHRMQVTGGGKSKQVEVQIDVGTSWGAIALPEGDVFTDQLY